MSDRPKIICLCGPARFAEEWRTAFILLAMAGRVVVGTPDLDLDPRSLEAVEAIRTAHLRLIDVADEVYVLNAGGYLGDDTRREIAYAVDAGKPVRWLEPVPADWEDEFQIGATIRG